MKNNKLLILIVVIPYFYSGCASVPKAKISNVDGLTVAQILWQQGNPRSETTPNDLMAPAYDKIISDMTGINTSSPKNPNTHITHATVWPDPKTILKKGTITIKYDISAGFGFIYCKDKVSLKKQSQDKTILSVKCENKHVEAENWGILGLLGFLMQNLNPVYERDIEREHTLMVNTTKILSEQYQAQIEWLGKWRPDLKSP